MFRSARSIWFVLLLAVALALPAFARVSGDETGGGGGGITILPVAISASSTTATTSAQSFSDYTDAGISVELPPGTTMFSAVLMLPGSDAPAVVLTSRSSSLHIPGDVLAEFWEAGVCSFAITIRTPTSQFLIKVKLKSMDEIEIVF